MSQRRSPIQPIISAYYSFKHWKMAGLFAAADYRVDFKVPIVPIDSDLILQFEMEMFSFGCLIKSTSKSTIVFFFLFFFFEFFFLFTGWFEAVSANTGLAIKVSVSRPTEFNIYETISSTSSVTMAFQFDYIVEMWPYIVSREHSSFCSTSN